MNEDLLARVAVAHRIVETHLKYAYSISTLPEFLEVAQRSKEYTRAYLRGADLTSAAINYIDSVLALDECIAECDTAETEQLDAAIYELVKGIA